MAAVTVTNASWSTFKGARHGPWRLSDGNLYAAIPYSGDACIIRSTDNGATWSSHVTLTTDAPTSMSATVRGDTMAIGVYVTTGTTGLHLYTWTLGGSASLLGTIATSGLSNTLAGTVAFGVGIRSDGSIFMPYQAPDATVMSSPYRRVSIARYDGTFNPTANTNLGVGNVTVNYDFTSCYMATDDDLFVITRGESSSSIWPRIYVYQASNAISSEINGGTATTTVMHHSGGFADGTSTETMFPIRDASSLYGAQFTTSNNARTDTGDISTDVETTFASAGAMVHDGTNYYVFWTNDAQTAIKKSLYSGGTTWTAQTDFLTGVTGLAGLNAQHLGSGAIGLLYNQGGTVKFDGIGLSAPALALTGAITGTSASAVGATTSSKGLTATPAGTSASAGALTYTGLSLSGASAGTSASAGSVAIQKGVAGSTAGTSAAAGEATQTFLLPATGSAAGTSVASVTTTTSAKALIGPALGTSTAAGTTIDTETLAGSTAGTSIATGDASRNVLVQATGSAAATSLASGSISKSSAISGAATATSLAGGALSISRQIAGSATGTSAAAGSLSYSGYLLVGTVAGTSIAAGDIFIDSGLNLEGYAYGTSGASGQTTSTETATGASLGTSAIAGQSTSNETLSGSIASSAASIGATTSAETLSANSSGTSLAAGDTLTDEALSLTGSTAGTSLSVGAVTKSSDASGSTSGSSQASATSLSKSVRVSASATGASSAALSGGTVAKSASGQALGSSVAAASSTEIDSLVGYSLGSSSAIALISVQKSITGTSYGSSLAVESAITHIQVLGSITVTAGLDSVQISTVPGEDSPFSVSALPGVDVSLVSTVAGSETFAVGVASGGDE